MLTMRSFCDPSNVTALLSYGPPAVISGQVELGDNDVPGHTKLLRAALLINCVVTPSGCWKSSRATRERSAISVRVSVGVNVGSVTVMEIADKKQV